MTELFEKVTKGLEVCREMNNPPGWRCTDCVECPYHENGCAKKLKEDALELLKEQQEAREHLSKGIGRLNKLLDKKNAEIARLIEGRPVHCKDCEIRDKGMACVCSTGDDWFCADGKQKERGDHG